MRTPKPVNMLIAAAAGTVGGLIWRRARKKQAVSYLPFRTSACDELASEDAVARWLDTTGRVAFEKALGVYPYADADPMSDEERLQWRKRFLIYTQAIADRFPTICRTQEPKPLALQRMIGRAACFVYANFVAKGFDLEEATSAKVDLACEDPLVMYQRLLEMAVETQGVDV